MAIYKLELQLSNGTVLNAGTFEVPEPVDGATFTPVVDSDGTLSWSNDKGLNNPVPVNIMGPVGPKGDPGVYILDKGETIADAPADADVVIDPYSAEAVFPENMTGGGLSDSEQLNLLLEMDMVPTIKSANGGIPVDSNGTIILRY